MTGESQNEYIITEKQLRNLIYARYEKEGGTEEEEDDEVHELIKGTLSEVRNCSTTSAEKVLDIREPVLWFANQMECKLKVNDNRKGGWQDYDQEMILYLLGELECELQKLKKAIYNSNIGEKPLDFGIFKWTEKNVIEECADVANFAMMIADNARGIGLR